ncbi:hypothetical protein BCR32DRAFT_75907 [Anaeromyces robustus]|uniref:Uncharacterized protein n=1 Tax=Anaeromyces robustus TaxID=1754192 RepID=A0A1Y1WSM2_9FUNG|nr:hypothetical protein BCR32DRAFT_75907 [Anaeromyces robustus]|eukprot:ORX76540.1 hypothetical protein BCR32DRAFT_75907 [Anaeromyces robustus]
MGFNYNDTFSYIDARNYYKSQVKECQTDSECSEGTSCYGNNCIFNGYCLLDKMETCSLSKSHKTLCYFNDYECKNKYNDQGIECLKNEDCLTNQCLNKTCSGQVYEFYIGNNKARYGFDIGENCNRNSDCLSNNCQDKKCGSYYMFDVGSMILFFTIFIAIVVLTYLLVVYCCNKCNGGKEEEIENKNKNKNKNKKMVSINKE